MKTRSEPDWLTDQRSEAWRQFQQMEWPSRRDEEWSRTDIRLFQLDHFPPPGLEAPASIDEFTALLSEGVKLGGAIAAVNGRTMHRALSPHWVDMGVQLDDVSQVAQQGHAAIDASPATAVDRSRHRSIRCFASVLFFVRCLFVCAAQRHRR